MTVLHFPARPATDLAPVQLMPVPVPAASAPGLATSAPPAAPIRVLPGHATADRVALAALIAATGPAAVGYLVDTGVPAAQLLANALAAAALVVHVGARCSSRLTRTATH